MKLLILVASLFSFLGYSGEINCQNLSDDFYEDNLSLNLESLSGEYFDNDTITNLACEKNVGTDFALTCKGGKFSVHVKDDGLAVVVEGDLVILHQCQLN